MERSPAEVSMRRHSPQPADRELSSETTRFSRTTESYRARKRQLEKKPGSIWSVTSRSSPAVPIFRLCVYTTAGQFLHHSSYLLSSQFGLCFVHCARVGAQNEKSVWNASRKASLFISSTIPWRAVALFERRNIVVNIKPRGLSLRQDSDVRNRAIAVSSSSFLSPAASCVAAALSCRSTLSLFLPCYID